VRVVAIVAGAALIGLVLWETFETLVLPRRVARRLRLTRMFFRIMWGTWSGIGRRHPGRRRENYLSVFAPLSLIAIFVLWGLGLVVGFALIQWGCSTPLGSHASTGFGTYLYLSATTFVTLGLGDVWPVSSLGRAITAVEAGAGFAFLAIAISYLPVLYQSFSRREMRISMLDQWAGSPPNAAELLRRAAMHGEIGSVDELLGDWESWSAELLESHLSYPILAYFRSQHDEQSWLAALTAVLDVSTLVLSGVEGISQWQARRTFAISRHAVVDLAQVLHIEPKLPEHDRVGPEEFAKVRRMLEAAGAQLDERAEERLGPFRRMYEPYVYVLSRRLEMPLPRFAPDGDGQDDWQRSAWPEPG